MISNTDLGRTKEAEHCWRVTLASCGPPLSSSSMLCSRMRPGRTIALQLLANASKKMERGENLFWSFMELGYMIRTPSYLIALYAQYLNLQVPVTSLWLNIFRMIAPKVIEDTHYLFFIPHSYLCIVFLPNFSQVIYNFEWTICFLLALCLIHQITVARSYKVNPDREVLVIHTKLVLAYADDTGKWVNLFWEN